MTAKIIMLGTGSPRVNKERFPASQILEIAGEKILIDCADGATMQLVRSDINPKEVKHLFFTHLHADHILGYANFLVTGWVEGRRELTVVGPVGTKKMHDVVIDMLREDLDYRMSLGRPRNGIYDVKVIEIEKPQAFLIDSLPNIGLSCESMVHNVPTFAYKFVTSDTTIVFSGDTAPNEEIIVFSKDADALVIDTCLTIVKNDTATNSDEIWKNLQKEHCTPEQVAYIAERANVKTLIMTHFLPGMIPDQVKSRAEQLYKGNVIVPNDLECIEVKSNEQVTLEMKAL